MSNDERLSNLLLSRATEGLTEEEARELERLLDDSTATEAEELELAAAAVDLAFQASETTEAMPEDLKQRILDQAAQHLPPASAGVVEMPRREAAPTKPTLLSTRYLGWYAAAAMLILALWAPWSEGPPPVAPTPTLSEQRAALIEQAPDLVQVAWNPPEFAEYANVTGDVVWSNRLQRGFMRLSGMPVNRKDAEQYQLWIVDPSRDERPIDGGVFDIEVADGEIIVPIDAKLLVETPQAFAITLEQAGGVVVSDGPLLVVAAV